MGATRRRYVVDHEIDPLAALRRLRDRASAQGTFVGNVGDTSNVRHEPPRPETIVDLERWADGWRR